MLLLFPVAVQAERLPSSPNCRGLGTGHSVKLGYLLSASALFVNRPFEN